MGICTNIIIMELQYVFAINVCDSNTRKWTVLIAIFEGFHVSMSFNNDTSHINFCLFRRACACKCNDKEG